MEIITNYRFNDEERAAILQTRDLMETLSDADFVLAKRIANDLNKILSRESSFIESNR